jgi:hypothetical protein
MRCLLSNLALVAATAAQLSAQRAQTRYVAPTSETVFTQTELSASSTPGQVVWVVNQSSVPIVVYSYALRNCENVRGTCGSRRINVKIRPAGREVIARISVKSEFEGMRYQLSFGYRADSASLAAMEALASGGAASAREGLEATREAMIEERDRVGARDIVLDQPALVALGDQLAAIRAEADSLVVTEGHAFLLRDVRLMALDSAGGLLGRVNGGLRWRYEQNMVLMNRADTLLAAMPGRAMITFKLQPPLKPLEAVLQIIVRPDTTPPLSARTASGRSGAPAAR